MACQLLQLFVTENEGDTILDLQIMKIFSGGPSLAPLSGNSRCHPWDQVLCT